MSITRRILFISEDKIKENSIIQLNVDGKILSQSIYDTQFSHLREILGDTLYNTLLDAVVGTKADPVVPITGDTLTLLTDYIQPFLSRAVLLKLLINLHYRVTDKGVLKYNDSQATSISPQELEYARNQLENEANSFKRILIKYLKEKFNDVTSGCESRDNDTTSRSIGWYLNTGKTVITGGGVLPDTTPAVPAVQGGNGTYISDGNVVNIGEDPDDITGVKGKLIHGTVLSYTSDDRTNSVNIANNQVNINSSENVGAFTASTYIRVHSDHWVLGAQRETGIQEIEATPNGTMVITDSSGNKGLEYAEDYSLNYTDRSLVDKQYVSTYTTGYVNAALVAINASIVTINASIVTINADIESIQLALTGKFTAIDAPTYAAMITFVTGVLSANADIKVVNDEVNGSPGNETTLYKYFKDGNVLLWIAAIKQNF